MIDKGQYLCKTRYPQSVPEVDAPIMLHRSYH